MAHACQPAKAPRSDTQFPHKYVLDPWCWTPDGGFHRSSDPESERFPRLSKGSRLVSADAIDAAQAFRLGLGIGTGITSLTGLIPKAVFSLLALSRLPHYAGDPDLWARLGEASSGRTWVDASAQHTGRLMRLMLAHYVGSPSSDAPLALIKTITGTAAAADRRALESDRRTAGIAAALLDENNAADCAPDIVRLFASEGTKVPSQEIDAMVRDIIDLLVSLPAEDETPAFAAA